MLAGFFERSPAQSEVLDFPETTYPERSFPRIAPVSEQQPIAGVEMLAYVLICVPHALRARFLKAIPRDAKQRGIYSVTVQDIRDHSMRAVQFAPEFGPARG